MEEEHVRYRQANFKQKLVISRKFSKWYLTDFVPMTELEEYDIKKARYSYRAFTAGGALIFGFLSFRMRRATSVAAGYENAGRDPNLPLSILNDTMMILGGFFLGHCTCIDFTYKNR